MYLTVTWFSALLCYVEAYSNLVKTKGWSSLISSVAVPSTNATPTYLNRIVSNLSDRQKPFSHSPKTHLLHGTSYLTQNFWFGNVYLLRIRNFRRTIQSISLGKRNWWLECENGQWRTTFELSKVTISKLIQLRVCWTGGDIYHQIPSAKFHSHVKTH